MGCVRSTHMHGNGYTSAPWRKYHLAAIHQCLKTQLLFHGNSFAAVYRSARRQHFNGKICYGDGFFFFLLSGVPAASSRVATAAPPPCPSRSTVSPQNGIFRYGRCRHYKAYFKTTDACACHMSGPRINETGRHTMSNTFTRRTRNKVTIYWRHEALPDRTAHAGTKQLGSPSYLDEQGLRNALKRAHR